METIPSPSKASPSDNDEPITLALAVRRLLALDDESVRHRWIERCVAHFPPDEVLPVLKDESEHHLNSNPQMAKRLAEALIFASELIERPEYRALGIMAMGDVHRVLGQFEDSVAAMDQAGDLFLALGNEVGWARTRNGWLRSAHHIGRGEAALPVADRARAILTEHQMWLRAANLTYNTAFVCTELGRYDEALAHYDRAEAIYASLGETAELDAAHMKLNKAVLLTQLGDFQTSLRLCEEVREVFFRHGQTASALRQDEHVAIVNAAQGHYTRALHYYGSVLAAMENAGQDVDAAWVSVGIVTCYLSLNRNSEARELAEETILRFERYGAPTEAATVRLYAALAHARLGDTQQALLILDEATRAFAAAGLIVHLALVTLQRATLHLEDENWSAATQEAARASALFTERGLTIRQAQADLVRARASLALGDCTMAEALAESALSVSREKEIPWLAHECQHVLGGVAEARGDLGGALDAYAQAVANIETMQSSLATELRTNFLADKLRVYEDAISASLRLARPELAFAYLERAKSRALVDYLTSNLEVQIRAREGTSPDLLDTLARLREEHNFFYNQLYGYELTRPQEAMSAHLDEATLRSAIRDREKRIARALERLALDRTEGLSVVSPAEEEFRAIPRLDDDTVLLEYYFRPGGGAVFVLSPDGITVVPLSARPREIQRLLHQWHLNLAATGRAMASNAPLDGLGRNARGILGALYRALIAPVAPYLAGCTRLIVIPYGPTHTVPFHALHDGTGYLLEAAEVSACLSSRVLRLCAERPRRGNQSALVMAHTNGGRLPAVLAEARAVTALLPGEFYAEDEATRAALARSAARHRVIHLAAHGEARLDNPTFAHIQLADGQLSTVDVFNLPLQGALVTLSACETGQSVVTGGDELIGLSRGFLHAGASTLVQSLWRVEDETTAQIMAHFYGEICAGQPKGAALRTAQRAMLSTHGVHPYYWAPFQLIGDSGPL